LTPINFSHDYIVRIYRFEKGKPRSLVGLVEQVGKKGKKAFNNYDELWEILNDVSEVLSENSEIKKKSNG